MDAPNAGAKRPPQELEPRPPLEGDLVALCRELNQRGARYVVVGGFALIAAGLPRATADLDLLVAVDRENAEKLLSALSTLPLNPIRELQPGELQQYEVIRVVGEIVVDLMRSAGGIDYDEAAKDVVVREVHGVQIPLASPRLLWRTKATTHRGRDIADLVFLRYWFEERGEKAPEGR